MGSNPIPSATHCGLTAENTCEIRFPQSTHPIIFLENWVLTRVDSAAIVVTTQRDGNLNGLTTKTMHVWCRGQHTFLPRMGPQVRILSLAPNTAEVRKVGVLIGLENRDGGLKMPPWEFDPPCFRQTYVALWCNGWHIGVLSLRTGFESL